MEGLGINAQLLLAQLINFGIIFFLLVWLLKKPLSNILKQRSDQIAQSLQDAEAVKQQLASIDSQKAELVAEAKKQADELVAKGQVLASDLEKRAEAAAKHEAAEIVKQARAENEQQKEHLLVELKEQIRDTVRESLKTSLSELPEEERRKLADRAIDQLVKKS